jgi:hypothetical protein
MIFLARTAVSTVGDELPVVVDHLGWIDSDIALCCV